MSSYGTYAIDTNAPNTPNSVGAWTWCNTAQTTFSTSNDASVAPICSTSGGNDVSFDSNGNLILTSVINSSTNVDTYTLLK